ncbi:MAG: amino acid adenylation domain-containing protein [Chloroflexota bacterium]
METTIASHWLSLTFGLTEGWWRFDDHRQGYPLIKAIDWQDLLLSQGFEIVRCLPDETETGQQWGQAVIIAEAEQTRTIQSNAWLLFADDTGQADLLAQQLQRQGHATLLVYKGDTFEQGEAHVSIDPGNPDHYQQLLDGADTLAGILHLWSLDIPPTETLSAAELESCQTYSSLSLLYTIQALHAFQVDSESETRSKIWAVTQTAQNIEGDTTLSVGQAGIWGIGNVASLEHPALWGGMIDLSASPTLAERTAVVAEVTAFKPTADRLVLRDNRRFVARLREVMAPPNKLTLKSAVTYLITGGLGALGLETAQWLAAQGVQYLVLVSRTKPTKAQQAVIEQLQRNDVELLIAQADVADEAAMRQVWADIHAQFPSVAGIIHAAGISGGGHSILQLKADIVLETVRSKMVGGWVLHQLTQDQPLDFFINFSSTTSVWGGSEQAHYASANQFQDAWATYRHQIGLPAVSINWGPWGSHGMMPERLQMQLDQIGLQALQKDQAFEALAHLLQANSPQITVAKVDWQRFRQVYEARGHRPLLSDIEVTQVGDQSNAPTETHAVNQAETLRQQLETTTGQTRQNHLHQYLQAVVGETLGYQPTAVDLHQSLMSLGLDSLMALTINNRLKRDLGLVLSIETLLTGATLFDLSQTILIEVDEGELALYTPQATSTTQTQNGLPDNISTKDGFAGYPLSQGQLGLWLQYQMAPESPAYNISYVVRLAADLDVPILSEAIDRLILRHPLLRTTYGWQQDQPWQRVHTRSTAQLERLDVTNWDAADIEAWLDKEADQLFDLENDAALRITLLQNRESTIKTSYLLALTVHHLAVDFWSLDLMVNELKTLYHLLRQGQAAQLPPPVVDYKVFVRWENDHLASDQGQQLAHYWQHQLSGDLPTLALPYDYQRPPVLSYQGATENFVLSADLSQTLRTLAKKMEVTPYVLFLTAFKVLLFRYTGQSDILVGTPATGREMADFANVVGYFVNPLVLRTDLADLPSAETAFKRVQQTVLGAMAHQSYPFPLLVQQLQPERDLSRAPLFQTMFIWDQAQRQSAQSSLSDAWMMETIRAEQRGADFELTLTIFETGEAFAGRWTYQTDLFKAETVEQFTHHFETLLESLAATPNQPVSHVPLLTADDWQKHSAWNDTQREYPAHLPVHQLFEQQVDRTPEATAIIFEEAVLSYSALNQRVNQLAHHLQALGICAGTVVGVHLDRSIEMVVSLLAILKTGGAYVPLDPAFPAQRLDFMVEDAGLSLVISHTSLSKSETDSRIPTIYLDNLSDELDQLLTKNPVFNHIQASEDLAYIIYTSGSTGQPKGVKIPHQALTNFLWSMKQTPGLAASDTLLSVTTLSFDIAALELFLPLIVGARLALASRVVATDGEALAELMSATNSTVMQATPSTWQLLIEAGWRGNPQLKALCGGEALSLLLAQQLRPRVDSLWNLYGPTETTIWSTLQEIHPDVSQILIGHPIANTTLHILDKQLQAVPNGVAGELYIGGDGLAIGYHNRPQLTAEKFVPNPFISISNDQASSEQLTATSQKIVNRKSKIVNRLYKTGDLARYLPDGTVEFLGRIDHQVKIRGIRIELGEIEACLNQHPEVQTSVVVVREDRANDKRLTAYLVLQNRSLSVEEGLPTNLRHFLQTKIPDYMIPSTFVVLDQLPLTPNGKINRKALPKPLQVELDNYIAPTTSTEIAITEIWQTVLDQLHIGIHDNFFELGGHSLLATQVVTRLRQRFDVELALRNLFENPTIATLAQRVTAAKQTTIAPIQSAPRTAPLPLSFAQQRLWFLDQLEGANPTYNIPLAVRLEGSLDFEALAHSFNALIERHEVLRTTFISQDGEVQQLMQPPRPLTIATFDLQSLPETTQLAEIERIGEAEALHTFDLSRDLMMRASLLLLGGDTYILLVTLHHIASDGWSMDVVVKEITAFYEAYLAGTPVSFPDLQIQYADFAVWQRAWLSGDTLAQQLAYWQKQFEPLPPVLNLPADYPRPAKMSYEGGQLSFTLPPDLNQKLKALSQQAGVTQFMTLLAAFKVLLYRYTGQKDIVVGSPIANRTRPEIENLIGFFVNTLALRSDLSDNSTFLDLLVQVKQTTQDAYEHQDLPFELLVEAVQPERSLSHSPLFQVLFTWQNNRLPTLQLPDLEITPFSRELPITKFDLTLTMQEQDRVIAGVWEFNVALFNKGTIELLSDHFERLLHSVVDLPDQPIRQIQLLDQTESYQQLVEWNSTQADYPDNTCIHHLFEQQVERTPNEIAIIYDETQLNNSMLNQRANQLAHYLQRQGVGPEVTVGLFIERSFDMIIGLMGYS